MLKVVQLTQTCSCCPAQWEGYTEDKRSIYIRYRWGYLSVKISPPGKKDILSAVAGEEIYGQQIGEGFDGDLSYHRLKQVLSNIVTLPR